MPAKVGFWPVRMMAKSMRSGDFIMTRSSKPKLLLFPASLRRESHQRRLINYLAQCIGGRCEIDILQEVNLPLFNQDLEQSEPIVKSVMDVHQRFNRADGIIVASPEYNGHVSPYLKNTVDWVSRMARIDTRYAVINPFRNKPLLLSSASTGWTGGILGLKDARSIFTYLGNLVVADQICVSDADQWVQNDSYKFAPDFSAHIERVVSEFVSLVERLGGNKSDCISDGTERASA